MRTIRLLYKKIFKLASLAGQILLESNAEEYRVEDTTLRIMQTSGLDQPSSFSNATGLFLSLTDSEYSEYNFSDVVRINHRANNIQKIVQVNEISRRYVSKEIDVDEAYKLLKEIKNQQNNKLVPYTNILLIICFVILFGGNSNDILVSILIGGLIILLAYTRQFIYYTNFSFTMLATAVGTIFILFLDGKFPNELHHHILLSAMIMPFYPATSMTNSMRDLLKGNNLAGVIKGLDALMTIISIALGFGIGIILSRPLILYLL